MLRHGAPVWSLWLFGAIAVPAGLICWHRLGPVFGLGAARGRVNPAFAYVALACLIVLLVLGFMVDGQ